MAEFEPFEDNEFEDAEPSEGEAKLRREDLRNRCKAANIPFEEQEAFKHRDEKIVSSFSKQVPRSCSSLAGKLRRSLRYERAQCLERPPYN